MRTFVNTMLLIASIAFLVLVLLFLSRWYPDEIVEHDIWKTPAHPNVTAIERALREPLASQTVIKSGRILDPGHCEILRDDMTIWPGQMVCNTLSLTYSGCTVATGSSNEECKTPFNR